MDSTSISTPSFWFYSESNDTWSYRTPSYIHMCPLATVLTDTRIVVENEMEHESQRQDVPYCTSYFMDTRWMDLENMPPMGSSSPIAHYPQDHLPVHYPCEEQFVGNENILSTGNNFDGNTPRNLPKTDIPKQSRIQKKSKIMKKDHIENSLEAQRIVKFILVEAASKAEAELDPEMEKKKKRAERERNRYHSMTQKERQAMRKRRYDARKQRRADKY